MATMSNMHGQVVNKELEGVENMLELIFEKLLVHIKKHENIVAVKNWCPCGMFQGGQMVV